MPKSKEPLFRYRYVVVLLAIGVQFTFANLRSTIGVAIVAMVNNSALPKQEENLTDACPDLMTNKSEAEETFSNRDGEFAWTPELQGYVLGSSQLLFVLAVPFAGKLTDLVGCKNVLLYGTLLSSLLTVVSPFAAWCHVFLFIAVQGLRGLFQGGLFSALAALMANWCPISERGFAQVLYWTGSSFGSAIGNSITGILCKSTLLRGWPLGFFVLGGLGLLTAFLLGYFVYDSPSDYPKMPQAELKYISENQENVLTKKRESTPWCRLFKSVPVYALACGTFGNAWTLAHFVSLHSTFLGTVMHFPVNQNGVYSALPFLLQIPFAITSGGMSSYLISKNYMTRDTSRKFWNFLGCFAYSLCMLGVCLSGCNRSVIVVLSIFAFGSTGLVFSGTWITPADMSPTFAASVTCVTCTLGLTAYFIVPVIGGYLTDGKQTLEQWHKIIYLSIVVAMSSASIFWKFGSAEVQPWNEVKEKKTTS